MPDPSITLALAQPAIELGASNSTTTITGTATYTDTAPSVGGANDGTITLAATAPEGWTITIEPASAFTLAPGASADFTLTITAPPRQPGDPDATGDATISANAASPGGRSATTTAPLTLTALAPPAIAPPWYQTPTGIAAIILTTLLILGATTTLALRRRAQRLAAQRAEAERAAYLDRETGITITLAGGPLQYGHKREVVYRLGITNLSQRPRVGLIDVIHVDNGWRAATQITKLPLSPNETIHTTLVVTPDAVITPGDTSKVTVRVKPEEAREKDERITLDVTAPKHGVPTDPHYKIVSVHREGANDRRETAHRTR